MITVDFFPERWIAALGEATLNPETRRAGGMVYTSSENIHKQIDPLFLNDLECRLAPAYYADLYTSCQRAKNENNYLLVRRTSPKRHRLVHRAVPETIFRHSATMRQA